MKHFIYASSNYCQNSLYILDISNINNININTIIIDTGLYKKIT